MINYFVPSMDLYGILWAQTHRNQSRPITSLILNAQLASKPCQLPDLNECFLSPVPIVQLSHQLTIARFSASSIPNQALKSRLQEGSQQNLTNCVARIFRIATHEIRLKSAFGSPVANHGRERPSRRRPGERAPRSRLPDRLSIIPGGAGAS